MMMRKRGLIAVVAVALVALAGCERSPDDVERWRNAQNGMKKLQEWATSSSEPMDVRIRALQVIVEENNPTLADSTLEKVKDKKARRKLVQGAVETVEKLWKKGNPPTIDEKTKEKGGRIQIKPNEPATVAKDAAYYLIPHAKAKNKEKLRGILDEWLASSWRIRNQAGKTSVGQLLPRATATGRNNALKWLEETDNYAEVASTLREHAGSKAKKKIAKILKSHADKNHPDLSKSLIAAVARTKHEAIVPYLEKAITDPKSSGAMVDQFMEALKRIQGERATSFFSKVVREHPGKLRWAAVNELINIRGKAGILTAATSLPLEKEQYEKVAEDWKSFQDNAHWFASFAVSEMIRVDVSTVSNTLVRALESDRWPVQVLALVTTGRTVTCATEPKQCGDEKKAENLLGDQWGEVSKAVQNLTSSRETIPAWGDETKRVGELAHDIANAMEKAKKKAQN